MTVGMLQLLAIGFPGNQFRGEIIPELDAIRQKGLARILDLVFVYKDEAGDTTTVQFSDLSDEEKIRFGMATGAMLGVGADGAEDAGGSPDLDPDFGITDEDMDEIGAELPTNSSALIILFEHLWSLPFKEAVQNARGMLIGNWIIQPELLVEAADGVEAAQEARQPV